MRTANLYTLLSTITLLFMVETRLFGQQLVIEGIEGPTNVTVGDHVTYTWGRPMNIGWEVIGGVLEDNSNNNIAYVTWTQAGEGVVRKRSIFTGIVESFNVSVTGEVAPNAPPQPSISTNLCGSKTLSRSGNPPAGVRWYWQTSPTGQSTSLGYNATRSISQSGTYYLRARNISGQQLWSSSTSAGVAATVYIAGTPPSPAVNYITDSPDILFCESRAVIVMPGSPSNQTYYWQGQNSNGTSTGNSGQNYEVTSSGTYYLRSKHNSVNCWSTPRAIEIVLNGPPQPASPSIISQTCESVTLQRPADPPGDFIWNYWQGTNQNGTSRSNNSNTYTVTETGRYYLRSYNSSTQCWGSPSYIDVETGQPPVPPMPSISRACGLTTVTLPSAPLGETFYWQFNAGDESTDLINSSTTLDFTQNQTLYLKSWADNLCWSEARTINITVREIVEVPSPEITYNCSHVNVIYLRFTDDTNTYKLLDGQGNEVSPELEGIYGPSSWLLNSNGTYFFEIDEFGRGSDNLCKGDPLEILVEDLLVFPSVNAGPDETAFAFGTPFNLEGQTPPGGAWTGAGTGSGGQFNPGSLAPGNYTVTYRFTSPNGCSRWDSKTVTLVGGPVLQASTENILPGNRSILRVAPEYDGYTWYKDGVMLTGEYTNEITVDQPGQYYVKAEAGDQSVNSNVVTINDSRENRQHNFIREYTVKSEGVLSNQELLDFAQTNMETSTQYIDGLGNALQLVAASSSPTHRDLVQTFQYVYGMELKSYLPYTHATSDGLVKSNALNDELSYETSDQYQFYSNSNTHVASTNFPYGENLIEPGASYRVQGQSHPGEAWQKSESGMGEDHVIEFEYTSNGENEVFLFYVSNGEDLVLKAYHAQASLFETRTTDENNHVVIELADRLGRTVLKKVQANVAGSEWAESYYVYDDFGNLRYVLPPEGVKEINTQATGFPYAPGPTLLAKWAFQYKYDDRQRMIEKKVPGAEPVFMIYDQRDRLVLTQDGNQRMGSKNEWTFTKYDALNRPILTGIIDKGASTVDQIRGEAEAISVFFENRGGTVHGYTNNSYPSVSNANNYLTATYYDDYTFPHAGSYTFVEELGNPAAFGRVKGQVTGSKVKNLDGSNTWLESVMYYDDRYRVVQTQTQTLLGGVDRVSNRYDFIGQLLETKTTHNTTRVSRTFDYDHAGRLFNTWHSIGDQVEWTDLANMTQNSGVLTKTSGGGSWNGGAASTQRIPAESNGSLTFQANGTNTYRMIGLSVSNTNANWNTIDYALYLRNNGTIHVRENGSNNRLSTAPPYQDGDEFKIERVGNQIKYWHNGTLLREVASTSQALLADVSVHTPGHALGKIYLSSTGSILLAHNEYNELGELIEKNLHSEDQGQTFEQSIDYRYNIRGWLKSINNAQLANTTDNNDTDQATDYWGMELGYNHALSGISATPTYNGNISAVKWSDNLGLGEATNVKQCAYVYTYDPMNRIKTADHRQYTSAWTANNHFQLSGLTYDLNGNIESLTRKDEQGVNMDILAYTYSGNQLLSVGDTGSDEGFKDGTNVGDDYLYDDNGNMTRDENKDIGTITYNHLNLPQRVERDANNYILYTYDAAGIKLRQEVYEAGALSKTTDYVGEFIYENNEIALIQYEEGRLVPTLPGLDPGSRAFEYQYHLKDHLGNTRVTFTTNPKEIDFKLNYESNSADPDDETLFDNLQNVITADVHDRVDAGNESFNHTNVQALNGATNGVIGSVLTIPVGAGDKISAEVYAKYLAPTSTNNPAAAIGNLVIAAITGSTGLNNYEGAINNGYGTNGTVTNLINANASSTEPMAFINLLFLPDDGTNTIESSHFAFKQVSSASSNSHALLALDQSYEAPESGYVVVYLSNESAQLTEVYFDDLEVTVEEHAVIQTADYYPFGYEMAGGYQRVTAKENDYLFAGKERQDELEVGWYDFGARMYAPDIARWNGIDNSAENYVNQSPYHYSGNNPVLFVDFDGNDYGVKVDRGNKTITIKAHFLTSSKSSKAFNSRGRDAWNAQSGKNVFVAGGLKALRKGKADVYTINVNVTSSVVDGENKVNGRVVESQTPRDDAANADQTGTVNSFDTVSEFPNNDKQNGGTSDDEVDVRKDKLNTGTTTHETSHAMGNAHTTEGGTLNINGGTSVGRSNVAETLTGVGIGGDNIDRNANSTVGDGTLLDGSTNKGLGQGKVISQKRYQRIMKRLERRNN